jgi:hypothetical protein
MALSSNAVKKISNLIVRQYPEVKGVAPAVTEQRKPGANGRGSVYLLKYEAVVSSSDGKKIRRWVRVTVDEEGKILRQSSSL